MRSWAGTSVPTLPGSGPSLRVYDTASGRIQPATRAHGNVAASMYVCGITPYDATHLGHAATYLTFDLVSRVWRDAGRDARYVQNVTDVDDPLLERATRDGIDWQELADREVELFRDDMTALRILPPDHLVGAVAAIPEVVDAVERLLDLGAAYTLDDDIYFSVASAPDFGYVSSYGRPAMVRLSAENGGDPDRAGKKDPLDPVLWRGKRPDEPAWPTRIGAGRPGWHIECTAIAQHRLGPVIDVQGGGRDLVFPHHEMSAAHAEVRSDRHPFAQNYVHVGMIGLHGEKMSKSKGNLLLVSELRRQGVDPMVIRLGLLAEHYRCDRDWTEETLQAAVRRLDHWRQAVRCPAGPDATDVLAGVRASLADDLDTPAALAAIDRWVAAALASGGLDVTAPGLVRDAADALLGVAL